MRVLIIDAGYVGLPLGAELARHRHEVFGLRRNKAAAGALEAAGITPLFADITRSAELKQLPSDFDWVVNCAASGGGGVEDYRRIYLEGMRNVVEWLAPVGTGRQDAPALPGSYIRAAQVFTHKNDGSAVDESSTSELVTETGRVLVEAERELLAAGQQRNFAAMILRVAGIYGPGRGYWFKQFVNVEARLDGDGARFLNMIHRDDVTGCIIAALECGRAGEIYNAVEMMW
ncbi:MAG TPA: NAD-dependent epimerase/dehydratase family protein [Candidatus Angelobacter sp.]|nr:NAD-dependent epimerase/dehydratase family protein [Candidatus Angelobacter sp.]